MKNNIVKERSFNFAVRIIKFYKYLSIEKKEFVLSKQILRSGTSIGANIEEALQAESKKDFIHKLSISNKEAFETDYWIRLLLETDYIEQNLGNSILSDCHEIQKLLTSIIKSTKSTLKPEV